MRAEQNIGPAGNFRRLLELADTEYLVLLPDDDLLYPGHLEGGRRDPRPVRERGLAHTAFDLIDEGSRVTKSMNPLGIELAGERRAPRLALERLMVSDFPICFWSVVYRTKAILDAGGIRAEEEPFGDIQLWMRMALDWDFGYVASRSQASVSTKRRQRATSRPTTA